MAQISITIPDAALPRVIADIGTYFGYQSTITDQIGNVTPNPETPAQFAKRMLITQIKGWMRSVETPTATASIISQTNSDIDNVGIS